MPSPPKRAPDRNRQFPSDRVELWWWRHWGWTFLMWQPSPFCVDLAVTGTIIRPLAWRQRIRSNTVDGQDRAIPFACSWQRKDCNFIRYTDIMYIPNFLRKSYWYQYMFQQRREMLYILPPPFSSAYIQMYLRLKGKKLILTIIKFFFSTDPYLYFYPFCTT